MTPSSWVPASQHSAARWLDVPTCEAAAAAKPQRATPAEHSPGPSPQPLSPAAALLGRGLSQWEGQAGNIGSFSIPLPKFPREKKAACAQGDLHRGDGVGRPGMPSSRLAGAAAAAPGAGARGAAAACGGQGPWGPRPLLTAQPQQQGPAVEEPGAWLSVSGRRPAWHRALAAGF